MWHLPAAKELQPSEPLVLYNAATWGSGTTLANITIVLAYLTHKGLPYIYLIEIKHFSVLKNQIDKQSICFLTNIFFRDGHSAV